MLKTLKPTVTLCSFSPTYLFILQMLLTRHLHYTADTLRPHDLEPEVTIASSKGMHLPPIARIHIGFCHFSFQKPFITRYDRNGKGVTGALQFHSAAPMGAVTYDLWPSMQVNKDMASKSYSTQIHPSFNWNPRWHFFTTPVLRHPSAIPSFWILRHL